MRSKGAPVGRSKGGSVTDDKPNAPTRPEFSPTSPAASGPILSVNEISISLGGRQVLKDVTFFVQSGEFTGLIGSNGAGKTTLLRIILGLQAPTHGTVSLTSHPESSSTKNPPIGYVPQKVTFDPDIPLRSRDLVALGIDGHRYGISLPSRKRRLEVDKMLESVDGLSFANQRIGTLSGGQQQRILIAHALISRPKLLVLDEPLAGLDISSEQEIVELLGRIAKEQDIAVLISAHEMNTLLPVMDRIVYIADGRVASGTTDEVVRPEILSRLYGHHVDVLHVHGRILVVAGSDAYDDSTSLGHEATIGTDAS